MKSKKFLSIIVFTFCFVGLFSQNKEYKNINGKKYSFERGTVKNTNDSLFDHIGFDCENVIFKETTPLKALYQSVFSKDRAMEFGNRIMVIDIVADENGNIKRVNLDIEFVEDLITLEEIHKMESLLKSYKFEIIGCPGVKFYREASFLKIGQIYN